MVERARKRASGATAASEEAEQAAKDADELPIAETDTERAKEFRAPGFARMRITWSKAEGAMIARIKETVDGRILHQFRDAYAVMSDLYDAVREPDIDPETSEIRTDKHGYVIWKRLPTGAFMEDWSRLSYQQRETFLFRITTAIFDWEMRAADAWTEAMMAKAIWQEKFAIEFDHPASGTIDDRNSYANMNAADDRYFALFLSAYSRKADAIVRTMNNLALRLRDTLPK